MSTLASQLFFFWTLTFRVWDAPRHQIADTEHLLLSPRQRTWSLLSASSVLKCRSRRLYVGNRQSGQTESISAQCCFTSGRRNAICSAAGNLFTGPQNIPRPPTPSLLQTVFYNVVWSLSRGAATSNSPQRCPFSLLLPSLTTCYADSTQPPQQGICGCVEREAHLGWQPLYFPLRQKWAPLCCLQAYWMHLSIPSAHIWDIHSFEQSVTSWLRLFRSRRRESALLICAISCGWGTLGRLQSCGRTTWRVLQKCTSTSAAGSLTNWALMLSFSFVLGVHAQMFVCYVVQDRSPENIELEKKILYTFCICEVLQKIIVHFVYMGLSQQLTTLYKDQTNAIKQQIKARHSKIIKSDEIE